MKEIKYCECCGQKVMIYKRRLRKTLIDALWVLDMVWHTLNWRDTWVTDVKVLKFWGFIYTEENKKSNIGITAKWKRFLNWEIRVPLVAYVFNNTLQPLPEWEKEKYVSIYDITDEEINRDSMLQEAIPVEM